MKPLLIAAIGIGALWTLNKNKGISDVMQGTASSDINIGYNSFAPTGSGKGVTDPAGIFTIFSPQVPADQAPIGYAQAPLTYLPESVAPQAKAGFSATGQSITAIGGAGLRSVPQEEYAAAEHYILYDAPITQNEDFKARGTPGHHVESGSAEYYQNIYAARLSHINPVLLKIYVGMGGDVSKNPNAPTAV